MPRPPRDDLPPIFAGVLILLLVLLFGAFLATSVEQAALITGVFAGAAALLAAARWIPRLGSRGRTGDDPDDLDGPGGAGGSTGPDGPDRPRGPQSGDGTPAAPASAGTGENSADPAGES